MSKLSDGHQLIATLITFNFNVVDSINLSFGRFPNFSPWSNLFLETIRCSRHSNGGADSSRLRPKMRVSRERDSERISRLICIWKKKAPAERCCPLNQRQSIHVQISRPFSCRHKNVVAFVRVGHPTGRYRCEQRGPPNGQPEASQRPQKKKNGRQSASSA